MLLLRAGDQGMQAPPEPTRMSSEKVIHQGTRSQGAHSGTTGATSAQVTCKSVARGTSPAARKLSASRSERGAPTLTYVSARPPSPTSQTRGGPGAQHTGPTSTPAPSGEHRNVTPSPARRAVRDPLTPERIILENVTSQGGGPGTNVPPARVTSEKIIHQSTRSRGTHGSSQGVPT